MGSFEIVFRSSVEKELKKIPKQDQIGILRRIQQLADDPRPDGCKKLSGQERYRIRQGDYRFLNEIEDQRLIVVIVRIGHRRDVYS